jgi:single-strand DNA-binding protein
MSKTNQCLVIGNLGADPEVRGSAKSGSIVGFTIAENVQNFDEATQKYKTVHTNWFNITSFGQIAERSKTHLKKGDRVIVQGKMRVSQYQDKSGEKRSGFEIIADEIALWKPLPSSQSNQEREQSNVSNIIDLEDDLPF